ncbi:MAG: hypothetical protein U0103_20640 [Candidatus Obscuribacterales bacterium]|nr:MAG: hypothetical protein EKK48_07660 [Candidatus Melainabacteria bacterium]
MALSLTSNHTGHATETCVHCSTALEITARFCGECGAPGRQRQSTSQNEHRTFAQSFAAHRTPGMMVQSADHATGVKTQLLQRAPQKTPNFAKPKNDVPQELKDELAKLIVLLARERLFLYMHCGIFLTANLFGFYVAMRCYNGFIGDEMSKLMMAMTPLLFINAIALACLAPIKGTKREIARLKEQLTYVKFQIEYRNVF